MLTHYTDLDRLDDHESLRHSLASPLPDDRLSPVTLVEQLVTDTATEMATDDVPDQDPNEPWIDAADVAPYAAETVASFAPSDRLTRYELTWLTAWLDHSYTVTPNLPEPGTILATDLPGLICSNALVDIVTRRISGDTTYAPTDAQHANLTLSPPPDQSPACSDQTLMDAPFTSRDTDELLDTLTTAMTDTLETTGRIDPAAVDAAFDTSLDAPSPGLPDAPVKQAALQDSLLARYPPTDSPVDLTSVTADPGLEPDRPWPDRITAATRPVLKHATIIALIEDGVLDATRHP